VLHGVRDDVLIAVVGLLLLLNFSVTYFRRITKVVC